MRTSASATSVDAACGAVTVEFMGWKGTRNGALVRLAKLQGSESSVTADWRLAFQPRAWSPLACVYLTSEKPARIRPAAERIQAMCQKVYQGRSSRWICRAIPLPIRLEPLPRPGPRAPDAHAPAARSRPSWLPARGCGSRSGPPCRPRGPPGPASAKTSRRYAGSRLPVGSSARMSAGRWPARGRWRRAAARRRTARPGGGSGGRQAQAVEQVRGAPARGAARHAGHQLRQHRRSRARRIGQQVVELVDEADAARGAAACARRR